MADDILLVVEETTIILVPEPEELPIVIEVGQQGPAAPSNYQLWLAAGNEGTVEEYLASLEGESGREIELGTSATHIQWRYVGDEEWTDLIALSELQGIDGESGREVELSTSATHIQWRYVGDVTWVNLVALSDLKGDPGSDATVNGTNLSAAIDAASPEITITDADKVPFRKAVGGVFSYITGSSLVVWIRSLFGSMASQSADAVAITGGTISATSVSATTGTFDNVVTALGLKADASALSGYVPTTRTVNGQALSSNITVTADANTLTGTTLKSTVVSSSLTSVGTLTAGTWNASVITGQYGGTGVANTGKTITLAGNLTTTGAFNTTFAQAGTTTVTLPSTSSTMARTDAGQTFTGNQTVVGSLTVDTNTLFVDSVNHKVGVGTLTPGGSLAGISLESAGYLVAANNKGFICRSTDGTASTVMRIAATTDNSEYYAYGTGHFTWLNGASEKMRLNNSTGNLSIGNTNNTYKLDVTGTSNFTGNQIVTGDVTSDVTTGTNQKFTVLGPRNAYARFQSTETAHNVSMGVSIGNTISGTTYRQIGAFNVIDATSGQTNYSVEFRNYYDGDLRFLTNGVERIKASSTGITLTGAVSIVGTLQTSGKVTANGQGTSLNSSANDVLTRTLSDDRTIMNIGSVRTLIPGNNANSTSVGGTGNAFIGTAPTAAAGTSATAWARVTVGRNLTTWTSFSGANIDCAKNYDISLLFGGAVSAANSAYQAAGRFVVGESGSGAPASPTGNALAARGWGFEVYLNAGVMKMRIFVHDGTTFATSADITYSDLVQYPILLRKTGGTLELYRAATANGEFPTTPTLTLTGAPTSGSTGGGAIALVSVNDGTNAMTAHSFCISPEVRVKIN